MDDILRRALEDDIANEAAQEREHVRVPMDACGIPLVLPCAPRRGVVVQPVFLSLVHILFVV